MNQTHTRIIHEALEKIPNTTLKIQIEIKPWFKPIYKQLLKCATPTRNGKLLKLHNNTYLTIDHNNTKILWLPTPKIPPWATPIKRG